MKSEKEIKAKIEELNEGYRFSNTLKEAQAKRGNFSQAIIHQNGAITAKHSIELLKWVLNEET